MTSPGRTAAAGDSLVITGTGAGDDTGTGTLDGAFAVPVSGRDPPWPGAASGAQLARISANASTLAANQLRDKSLPYRDECR